MSRQIYLFSVLILAMFFAFEKSQRNDAKVGESLTLEVSDESGLTPEQQSLVYSLQPEFYFHPDRPTLGEAKP